MQKFRSGIVTFTFVGLVPSNENYKLQHIQLDTGNVNLLSSLFIVNSVNILKAISGSFLAAVNKKELILSQRIRRMVVWRAMMADAWWSLWISFDHTASNTPLICALAASVNKQFDLKNY